MSGAPGIAGGADNVTSFKVTPRLGKNVRLALPAMLRSRPVRLFTSATSRSRIRPVGGARNKAVAPSSTSATSPRTPYSMPFSTRERRSGGSGVRYIMRGPRNSGAGGGMWGGGTSKLGAGKLGAGRGACAVLGGPVRSPFGGRGPWGAGIGPRSGPRFGGGLS